MKFFYGRNDWKTMERGEEQCYLMTNGMGGFSSLTLIGSCCRNDQAVLMACTHAPNCRYNMIHRLEERVAVGEHTYVISSQDVQPHTQAERGEQYLSSFSFEHYPQWDYILPGVEICKRLVLVEGKNTVGISYHIQNRAQEPITLTVRPHLQFVPKGERLKREQEFSYEPTPKGAQIHANGLTLHLHTNGVCQLVKQAFYDTLYYRRDVEDGKMTLGRTAVNHQVCLRVPAGESQTLELVYGLEEDLPTAAQGIEQVVAFRSAVLEKAACTDALSGQLALSAMQFISDRVSTGKKTILAGFPFFEDWGRDTMIALPGCCLSTKQYDIAKAILETFMAYAHKGLMPNLFPEGSQKPWYNTVDAALLFILTVHEYEAQTGDKEFVKSAYPIMEDIIAWYEKGTDFNIHMDTDGLIVAGQGYDQVTWMDVRVEDILPTPRHGKPVEINAYWYNALRMMEHWQGTGRYPVSVRKDYGAMAQRVKESFQRAFWNETLGCLRDVISGTKADDQIRCNQIWAVSMPYSLLPEQQERQVVETVFRHLYTPYGLRTLSPQDEEFRPVYGGAQLDRDLAYHQGTVWGFPLGAYYRAYLKVNGYSDQAKQVVRHQLSYLEGALREGCVGQLPEIYDGEHPVQSQGCFAQAWSVGELLRVWDDLNTSKGGK